MSALSELVVPIIYILLALGAIRFLFRTFKTKRSNKPWTLLIAIAFVFLIFSFRSWMHEGYKQAQLAHVGTYYLTNYPGCDSAVLELKENMTYEVRCNGHVVKESNWHYESGGDYWITYLDNDGYQLGSGDYAYKKYELKYPESKN